jgi:hypothetical protein
MHFLIITGGAGRVNKNKRRNAGQIRKCSGDFTEKTLHIGANKFAYARIFAPN